MRKTLQFAGAAILTSGLAGTSAQADLLITEVWQDGDEDGTPDWVELTNFGSTAIDPTGMRYDDDSFFSNSNALLTGIDSIAPGESVVYLISWHDDFSSAQSAVNAFNSVWGNLGTYSVGYILDGEGEGGPGLGGGGDGVGIFDIDTSTIDMWTFGGGNDTQTWVLNPLTSGLQRAEVGVFGGFESATNGYVGSPGVIPEPASLALLAAGGILIASRRRTANNT